MKKIVKAIAVLCIVSLALVMAVGCNKNDASDLEYVKNKGKLVIGITDFAPMDYRSEAGDWIGFDADLGKAFAKELGVEVEFVEIDWDSKILELENKSIDCVWNGMTLSDEVKSSMECSNAYCKNAQVVVLAKEKVGQYKDVASMKDINFAVEVGSAGKDVAEENGLKFTEVQSQATALTETKAGTCDGAIIDLLMAGAMVGEGTGYADLTTGLELNSEEYGVGFRKGSDLAAAANDFFKKAYDDGTMKSLGTTYGVAKNVLPQ